MKILEEVVVMLCNCPDHTTAENLAEGLVQKRLAACVNILAPVQSVYHWEGKIEKSTEIPIMIKTVASLYLEVQSWVITQHPYKVPEIIAWQPTGLPAYLDWVCRNVETPRCA